MAEKRRLIINSLSILMSRLAQSIASFVLTAAIARSLGADALGQYLLGFTYYFVFMTLASQGLKTLFTRELSRAPEETSVYLSSGTLLQLIFSLVGYVALVLIVSMLPYSADTSTVCYIMGLTIFPFSLSNITEAALQAQERMHLIAIATVPIYIIRLLVVIWAMQLGYGMHFVAGILVLSEGIVLVTEWLLLLPTLKIERGIKKDFIWRTVKAVRTFFVLEGAAIISSNLRTLLLSVLGNETIVGLYGSISQLMQPFWIIAGSATLAIFPSLSKLVELDRDKQRQMTENLIEFLFIVALPFFCGLLFFGNQLLLFVYRDPIFSQAAFPLFVSSLSLWMLPFSRSLGYVLVANGYENIGLREAIFTALVGGAIGCVLVYQYKLLGASLTDCVMSFTAAVQLIYAVQSRLFALRLWRIFKRPLIVSGCLLPMFFILQELDLNFLSVLVISTLGYGVVVAILGAYTLGKPQIIWSKLNGK